MKSSTHTQTQSSLDRLAPRKPIAWLIATLLLTITGLLYWRHTGGDEMANPNPIKAVTSGNRDREQRAASSTGRTAGDGFDEATITKAPGSGTAREDGGFAIAELIRLLNASAESKDDRQRAAVGLAKDGSDTAVRALQAALISGSPELQVIIAKALGQCPHPASGAILEGLLTSENESVVLSAIGGLSQQASPLAVASLSQLLFDDGRTVDVRAEAALGIGAIARPEALATLIRATAQIQDEAVASQVIRGLAGRSIDETRSFLQAFLEAPEVSAELKAEALEGLGQAKGDATPLLILYAQSHDAELRAAAAQSLNIVETRGNAGAEVIELLKNETDPLVRKRLYEALSNQQSFDLNAAWTQAANENDPAARIAGLDVLARAVQQSPSSEMIAFFDEHALPELKNVALSGETKEQQLASIMALRRAKTANAMAALREIASQSSDARVAAATGIDQRAELRR